MITVERSPKPEGKRLSKNTYRPPHYQAKCQEPQEGTIQRVVRVVAQHPFTTALRSRIL